MNQLLAFDCLSEEEVTDDLLRSSHFGLIDSDDDDVFIGRVVTESVIRTYMQYNSY